MFSFSESAKPCIRSHPLPPASRLEGSSQDWRCVQLRLALREDIDNLLEPYFQAYCNLKSYANGTDLEKYYDIYEISRIDGVSAETIATSSSAGKEVPNSLNGLKRLLSNLHLMRKLVLCSMLALDTCGVHKDVAQWPAAIQAMQSLTSLTNGAAQHLDRLLSAEQGTQHP